MFPNILLEERDQSRTFDQMKQHPSMIHVRTRVIQQGRTEAIEISIEDNGLGMDAATRDRLFNPFFTAKPIGKGTVLGLSISYQIITDRHSGTLTVQSEPGQGATFLVRLPMNNVKDFPTA
ncbi:MAG: sensor histidine kinase [Leptolyngbyaceae cyanobacterium]